MKIEHIDKTTYRKHLNVVIVAGIISLATLSLAISQSSIFFFTDREGTHFWINVMGVVFAMLIIGQILNRFKSHPFMTEVYYVYRLKQQINFITRKLKKVEAAAQDDNVNALLILAFYYQACHQLYTLDDNTITLSSLTQKQNALLTQIEQLNLTVDVNNYQQSLLEQF